MEEESSVKLISISDLLNRQRPLTGASYLSVSPPIHRPTLHNHRHQPSDPQSPNNFKILKPHEYPTLLIGTLNLTSPSFSCSNNSSCLKFSDHSATVCCDILDLDFHIIGRRIRVLSWNFLPVKPHGGYLEIIRWSVDQTEQISVPNFNAFYLNSVIPTYEESIVPRNLVYGLLNSISPVTNVPCTANKNGTNNLNGFLAEITVCECELCSSRDRVVLLQDITKAQNNNHKFSKCTILYFCGSASIWYPAITRLVGRIVMISGMKKKMVFIGEKKSLMMYVTTEKTIIHLPTSTNKRAINGRNYQIRQKRLCNVYTGSITGVYMQGMVIELDQNVLLLLTDHQLSMPHSLRIGAIITVRNLHIEDPKFGWTKVKVFGSCYKTSICVNVFSPIESRCYQVLQSRSLLRKFIESLTFSARLWVLLVVSSLKKKFAGILSEIEILGSKHIEGLVQKYSSSCLPLSVFRFRHGVLSEYCLHDLCGCGKEIDYNTLNLVVPVSNLISQCESIFIKSLSASGTDSEMNNQNSSLVFGGKSHDQPIKKIYISKDMNVVLLGKLNISRCTGRLQLIDATGSIDIVIPDLPSVWSTNDIYEINDFSIVMEGFPQQVEHLESPNSEPFSCGNIFNHFYLTGRKKFSIYIRCYFKDQKSRNHILCRSKDMEESIKDLENGKFHLLSLIHRFPIQQKFPGDNVVSKNSSVYAEAIIYPWNLVIHTRDEKQCNLQELPCSISCQIYSDKLNHTIAKMQEDCKKASRKLLMEFKSDTFCKYESLRIGEYYVLKHHEKDPICSAKDSKLYVNSKSLFWNVSFSADVAGAGEIYPDIYLNLSADHLSFLEVKLREVKQSLIQPTNSIKELFNSCWSPQTIMNVNLPVGSLLHVQGHVVAVVRQHGAHHRIVPGVTNSVCIHVLIDNNIVKIYSSLSEFSYPTGFGPGVKASFHRVLLTAEGNMCKLTPVSFIEINSIVVEEDKCSNQLDDKSVVETDISLQYTPAALISQIINHKHMRLHCKVVTIYVLIMKKKSEIPYIKIPLAGFIIDDGSSLCCCWTDNEMAVTLLGLHESFPHKRSRTDSHKSNNMSRISKILEKYGMVVIKNNGSVSDSSCLDVAISVKSDSVISGSDEQFLNSLILNACSINTWNVVGSVLDQKGVSQLEERLGTVDMMMLPLQNIWVSQVSHLDTLNEGRSILQELLDSK